ncbi:YbaB/EbfC family nucleoid-associated protein [Micromonospora zamorensis]|uniref:YbaB/EbfC family nucleoid-associated protein n=1 Tax=Micromonospora zamorensis TaxID=709883 RepID=UPI0008201DED|nr:YbaB/EbfC family nucleoid-associated protein [Micromonospora zamorensis]WTE88685.1 YbaB/EbfC family nucleoid-associated protein [Micromonospora zamorensis]SCG49791.1 YbaB/EbfC DNA-binding family protein [Micromonospora zamorensis]
MTDPTSAFDALAGRIADIERQFAGLRDNLAELSGTATDESGLVSATVDATGALTGLTLAPAALRAGTEGVAELVLDAYRRARAVASTHVDEHTEGFDVALGAGLGDLFGTPGDFSALGRLEETVARLGRLDDRLPGAPA